MVTLNAQQVCQNVAPGVSRKILSYSKNIMSCELTFKKGAVGAPHHHPHEQIGYVISGSFEVTDDGKTSILHAGDSYYIEPDHVHGVVALEDSMLLDVFTPMREDFV